LLILTPTPTVPIHPLHASPSSLFPPPLNHSHSSHPVLRIDEDERLLDMSERHVGGDGGDVSNYPF
jgi:hypothetical protein